MSCHCFTDALAAEGDKPPDYNFEGERRYFCEERFQLSKSIFPHFEGAFQRARSFKVIQTRDASGNLNFLTVDNPEDGYRYCIFFDVKRRIENKSSYVLIHIRSAYRKHIKFSSRQKVKLGTLIDRALDLQKPNRARKGKKK
jgi:hypothetical protein